MKKTKKLHPVIQLRANANAFDLWTKSAAKMICRVHFIGIGGIGVSALARYYAQKGCRVSGSDLFSSEITNALEKMGIKIFIGKHKAENLPKGADLVIFSPAVKPDNPELVAAKKLKIKNSKLKIVSYPQALGELTKKLYTIAVSGTHGKSTTTAMLSLILIKAGLNPTVILGTKLREFSDSNFRMGGLPKTKNINLKPEILLIEADEHFASFLNYWPKILVITNIAADHLDFYKNIGNIRKTFKKYISHVPKDGTLIMNKDDENSRVVAKSENNPDAAGSGLRPKRRRIMWFSLLQPEAGKLKTILKIPGDHMVSDGLAAIGAARALGVSDKISFEALSLYNGAWRRFEILKSKPYVLISDYGHNPQKMLATLRGARQKYPNRKIRCVYQPHQYQRTHFLFKEFVKAFRQAPADEIIITDIYDVAGREEKKIKKEVSSEKLAKAIKKPSVIYIPKDKVTDYLKQNVKKGEVVIIMGAGDIYKVCDELIIRP